MILGIIFLIFVCLYNKTQVFEVFTADSAEMVTAAYVLGIPHPTSYPLYCQLGRTFIQLLPVGNVASRTTVLSVLTSAACVIVLFCVSAELFGLYASVFISLLAGLSLTIWSQATIQEVYTVHILLISTLLFMAVKLYKSFANQTFYLFMFLLGMAINHHLLTFFLIPGAYIVIFGLNPFKILKLRSCLLGLTFFIMGLSNLLYLPIRSLARCEIRWLECHHFHEFLFQASGRQFRGMMFNITFAELSENIGLFWYHLTHQWGWHMLPLILLGILYLCLTHVRIALGLMIFLLCSLWFALTYRIPDIDVYYIQGYIPIIILMGAGIHAIYSIVKKLYSQIVMYGILTIFMGWLLSEIVLSNYYYADRSSNMLAYDWGVNSYNCLPLDSILITQGWSSPFIFSYMEHVLQYRPDTRYIVDYTGSTLKLASQQGWEIPVCTTVPMEILGYENLTCKPLGTIYQVGFGGPDMDPGDFCWTIIQSRGLRHIGGHVGYHDRALLAKYRYLRGEKHFVASDVETGLRLLEDAEELGFDNHMILNNLSGIYFNWGHFIEAERLARASLKLKPAFFQAHHNLGNALFKLGNYQEAISEFNLASNPNFSLGRNHEALGFSYLRMGNFPKAINELKAALELNPDAVRLRLNISLAYQHTGNIMEAYKHLNRVVEEYPDLVDGWNNLGLLEFGQQKYKDAARNYRQALSLDPDHINTRVNYAVLELTLGNWKNAETLLCETLEDDPNNTSILNNLALLYYKQNKITDAIDLWDRSLKIDPEQPHISQSIQAVDPTEYSSDLSTEFRSGN